ncbi:hypothetical protein D7Y21_10010 [Corallococcus sp. AB045]|nr:hypothetical protein D7Y21_10010 [Corallococcus sp. AB045]
MLSLLALTGCAVEPQPQEQAPSQEEQAVLEPLGFDFDLALLGEATNAPPAGATTTVCRPGVGGARPWRPWPGSLK